MKNVLILSGSPRKGGNSDILCDEFLRGAEESGNKVTKINVVSKKIAPCHACYYCRDHGGECAYKDDMADILQQMIDADVIVLASPVYFYSIDAQLKAVIDRTVARWLEVRDKEFYYIMTAADDSKKSYGYHAGMLPWICRLCKWRKGDGRHLWHRSLREGQGTKHGCYARGI
ncbi:MAG: flavodoxin family protein [Coprococcus sp.]